MRQFSYTTTSGALSCLSLTTRRALFQKWHLLQTQLWCKLWVCVRVCPPLSDTEGTAANEAAGGRNEAVCWQPEGRGAKVSTIIADTDAERTWQGKRPDQVKKHAYGEGDVETARTRRVIVVVLIVKGVFPCFSELTSCTYCYKGERDQRLVSLQAH